MLSKLMFFQVAAAPAAAPGAAGAPDATGGIVQMLIMFGPLALIFYFLLWRPQQQRAKKQKELLGALKRGDEVFTQAGIIGKIIKIADNSDEVTLDTGEGGKLRILRSTIVDRRTKAEPQPANDTQS
jgi:preprotein translocase subunit YajC